MTRILPSYWQRLENRLWRNLCCFLFYPTEASSASLQNEVLEIMGTPAPFPEREREPASSKAVIPEVVNETTAPTVHPTNDVGQPVPTEPAFEPIQAPISEANREATLQTVLPILEANEPVVPSVEKPPPET